MIESPIEMKVLSTTHCNMPRTASRLRMRRCALALFLSLPTAPLWAATCNVSTQGVSFGAYDVFSTQQLDGAGTIGVSCDVSTTHSISLSPGAGSYAGRTMASGAHTLTYNLYRDATRTSVWGDGTSGTATVGGTATSESISLYGRIPAQQNKPVGSYSDSITVTLTF